MYFDRFVLKLRKNFIIRLSKVALIIALSLFRQSKRVSNLYVFSMFLLSFLSFRVLAQGYQASSTENKALYPANFELRLESLGLKIDARLSTLKTIASMIANDSHVHDWVENGYQADKEQVLLDKLNYLVERYELTSASFADKASHRYWNHEGFLRVLDPKTDTWYFSYLASKQQDLISVYHDKNKHRVDLYVNFQQVEGRGLSGIATSFDSIAALLETSEFAKAGKVYLVNSKGIVQVSQDLSNAGKLDLNSIYPDEGLSDLMNQHAKSSSAVSTSRKGRLGAYYIPSVNWYLVAFIAN